MSILIFSYKNKKKTIFKTLLNPLKNQIIFVCFISFYYSYNIHIIWYSNIRDNIMIIIKINDINFG